MGRHEAAPFTPLITKLLFQRSGNHDFSFQMHLRLQ